MRHDRKMRRAAERKERAEKDPWFGKRRVTSFPNKKKDEDKYGARKKYRKDEDG